MGYHVYCKTFTFTVGEVLQCQTRSDNNADKYTVAVMNKNKVVRHLMKGKNGQFTKMVFFFLRGDVTNSVKMTINGKIVNEEKGMGMEIPCIIILIGPEPMLDKLK